MKFTANTEKLREACLKAEKVAGKTNSLPVIRNIVITADKNNLTVKSTNLDIGVEINVPGKVFNSGSWAVSGSVFGLFLSTIKNEQVTVELIGGSLVVSSENNNTLIKVIPATDFPLIPQKSGDFDFSMKSNNFISSIRKVFYAASNSQIKPEISGVYMHSDQNESKLYFVATDSFRLAEERVIIDKNKKNDIKAIIPIKNVNEIIRLFEGLNEDLFVWINQSQISFLCGGVYVTSRLVGGLYPNYKQIIPVSFKTEFFVNIKKIQEAVKTSLIFTDSIGQLLISVHPKESQIILVSKNEEIGESSINIPVKVNGEETVFNCNIRYLNDVFQSITEETISFKLNEHNKPFIVQGFGNNNFNYLIMPMNR